MDNRMKETKPMLIGASIAFAVTAYGMSPWWFRPGTAFWSDIPEVVLNLAIGWVMFLVGSTGALAVFLINGFSRSELNQFTDILLWSLTINTALGAGIGALACKLKQRKLSNSSLEHISKS